jgi:hypothetical protein
MSEERDLQNFRGKNLKERDRSGEKIPEQKLCNCVKTDHKETGCGVELTGSGAGSCACGNESSGSVKCGFFLAN